MSQFDQHHYQHHSFPSHASVPLRFGKTDELSSQIVGDMLPVSLNLRRSSIAFNPYSRRENTPELKVERLQWFIQSCELIRGKQLHPSLGVREA